MKYLYRNFHSYCVLLILSMTLLSAACSRSNDELPAVEDMVNVGWVLYEEQEPGAGQYPVRIMASKQYLRFDDNYDASDFLLLDRRSQTMFSVSHAERSILVIDSQTGDASLPAEIVLTEERNADSEAPKIDGRSTLHVRFKANEELCYEAFVVSNVLEEVTAAITEYLQQLGLRQLHTLDTVPAEMQTPCFLSRHVYRPARHLQEGLPVREWDAGGYMRTLMDYREQQKVSHKLFKLPEDYKRISID